MSGIRALRRAAQRHGLRPPEYLPMSPATQDLLADLLKVWRARSESDARIQARIRAFKAYLRRLEPGERRTALRAYDRACMAWILRHEGPEVLKETFAAMTPAGQASAMEHLGG